MPDTFDILFMPGHNNGLFPPIFARLRYLATGRARSKHDEMYDLLASIFAENYPTITPMEDSEIRRRLWEAGY